MNFELRIMNVMTIKGIQEKYQAPSNVAGLDFLLILAHVIKKDKSFIFAHPEYQLSLTSYLRFCFFVWQRKRGVPLAYITGHKEFFGIDFLVNKHTLIPRPDTEILVEEVVKTLTTTPYHLQPTLLIDVGTGSGCIPIAIGREIKKQGNNEIKKIFAIDISESALRVAKKNARIQNVSIEFLQGSLLEPILSRNVERGTRNVVITANLPYGWKEWKNESSAETVGLKFEPANALFTGENGLELIRKLLEQVGSLISQFPNFQISAFIEFDPRQTPLLKKLVANVLPRAQIEIKKDLGGLERVAIVNEYPQLNAGGFVLLATPALGVSVERRRLDGGVDFRRTF